MAGMSLTDMGVLALGAGAGAAVSQYGSNSISNALTKKNRTQGDPDFVAASEVAFWKKAYVWDLGLGLLSGAGGYFLLRPKGSGKRARGMMLAQKGVAGMSAYLLANGLLDMIGDLTREDADKTYNGRPVAVSSEAGVAAPGPLSRKRAVARAPRARAMQRPRALRTFPVGRSRHSVALL